MKTGKLPLIEALSWIIGVTLVFSVVMHKVIQVTFSRAHGNKTTKEAYINYIIQTGPYKEALHSDYLMEILGLSTDCPVSYASFNPEVMQKKLLHIPIIKEALIKKIKPNSVFVDYALRKPVVWAVDFVNAALDREGTLFPMHPFFSPKKIPKIYIGKAGLDSLNGLKFGHSLQGPSLTLAFLVLDYLQEVGKDLFFVKKVDVSNAFIKNLGKRELVVIIENEIYVQNQVKPIVSTHFLRLSPRRFQEEISNYKKLRSFLLEAERQEAVTLPSANNSLKPKVIDMRLEQLAFVQ